MYKQWLVIALVLVGSPAWAASNVVESVSTGLLNSTDVKVGDDSFSSVNFKLVVVVNKSSYSLLKAGDVLTANCVGMNKNVGGESLIEGMCLIKDSAGDTYSATYQRKGKMGTSGAGTQTVKGLTGKFVGMTGSCTYDAKPARNDGIYLATFTTCNYQN